MLVLVFILLGAVNSFLLDTPQGQTTSNQYLSLSKFYEEIKLQEQKSTLLRHDMDNSLNLLTTQLQQKFDLLDKKLAEIERQNETIPVAVNLEQRFTQLEQKYLNLEQNYNTLTKENNVLQIKKNEMENELFSLRNETINQHKELELLKNKSLLTDQNVEALGHLKSIQPLQEIKTLQQQVGSISAQTSSLNMKDQARNQDFLALYDKVQKQGTINTRSMTNLSTQLKTLQMDLGTQIKSLQTIYNTSITDLDMSLKILQKNQSSIFVGIESKIDDASLRDHQTLIQLQRQIATCNDQVSMTAHPSSSTTKSGKIKFDNVAFSIGINNLSAYKSTGKFICEKEGIYMISVSIYSYTNGAHYLIYRNGHSISCTEIVNNSNSHSSSAYSGTIVLALQLHPNDSVWVYFPGVYQLGGGLWSTLTIIKLK